MDWVEWGDIWRRPLHAGIALEWATLMALIHSASEGGWSLRVPLQQVPAGEELFPLRNQIPTQHGAQVGHSATTLHDSDLSMRFITALTPKVILEREDQVLS